MDTAALTAAAKKRPIVVISVAISLICAVLLYLQSSKIEDTQVEFETKSAEAAKIMANVRNAANLAEQVADVQNLAKEMNGRLVRAGQLAINQQYFYKLEAENEVKLVDIHPGAVPAVKGSNVCTTVPFNLGVQGSFKQVMAFLGRLEGGRHFCRFSSVNVTTSPGVAGGDGLSLALSIELLGTP